MPVQVRPVEARPPSRGNRANQRKLKHRQMAGSRHIRNEFRDVERTIGFALRIPLLFYW